MRWLTAGDPTPRQNLPMGKLIPQLRMEGKTLRISPPHPIILIFLLIVFEMVINVSSCHQSITLTMEQRQKKR